jgi:hypothetical protein
MLCPQPSTGLMLQQPAQQHTQVYKGACMNAYKQLMGDCSTQDNKKGHGRVMDGEKGEPELY